MDRPSASGSEEWVVDGIRLCIDRDVSLSFFLLRDVPHGCFMSVSSQHIDQSYPSYAAHNLRKIESQV